LGLQPAINPKDRAQKRWGKLKNVVQAAGQFKSHSPKSKPEKPPLGALALAMIGPDKTAAMLPLLDKVQYISTSNSIQHFSFHLNFNIILQLKLLNTIQTFKLKLQHHSNFQLHQHATFGQG
jgi:hypothetical protein